jgi:carbamoyl-phosphate synthase (ammonia)
MFSDSLYKHKEEGFAALKPQTLFEHYQAESDADAWTSPTEFH